VVTVLFADLVGFTKLCEQTDPEDVDQLLREYYALARTAIEAYGGVVQKYIGDAVAGVFGLPKVHEDDPERAVRAGLRLVERLSELPWRQPVHVRVGVNTGPALVRLDVDPGSGQGFLIGDAVNTAARLQAAAPAMQVVVGELTHKLSARVFEYEAMAALAAKGKAELLRPWLVKAPIARTGIDLTRTFSTPLVGREVELGILKGLFEKAVASASPQFALVTGEAGIGKSRLVFELARHLEGNPEVLVTWRQGRTLPYREGAAFSALREIVRAHCGVLESDDEGVVEAKLSRVLPDTAEAAWIKARLSPLLGIESAPAPQEENFSAWVHFMRFLAQGRPLVVVFEDLHWAGEGTLAFLAYLSDHLAAVPLLLIATARPELHDARPDFAPDERWVALRLRSLSPQETARLVDHLAGDAAADVERVVTERCGGNPFFTEELVRLLRERSLLAAEPGKHLGEAVETALPDSLQALVAARLDSLQPRLKAVLADAAVVGQTFWPGAVSAAGQHEPDEVGEALRKLASREFVRPLPSSAIDSERQFAFSHALTREVAYGQLPRMVRAHKHAAVARWIESNERPAVVAEVLVHHYTSALDLARTVGDAGLAAELVDPAAACLELAGDTVLPLDVAAAERHYARALALLDPDKPERTRLLVSYGEALAQTGRLREGACAIEEAIDRSLAASDLRAAATAMVHLDWIVALLDDSGRDQDLIDKAVRMLEKDGPSPELAMVLDARVRICVTRMDNAGAIEAADRAVALCRQLGQPEPTAAIGYRGMARGLLGDERGIADLEAGIAGAKDQGLARLAGALHCNLAEILAVYRGPEAALAKRREGLEYVERRGDEASLSYLREGLFGDLIWAGRWDEALAGADELDRLLRERDDVMDLNLCRANRALLLSLRGDVPEAVTFSCRAQEEGRHSAALFVRCACLVSTALVSSALGHRQDVVQSLAELSGLPPEARVDPDYLYRLALAGRLAVAAGRPSLAVALAEGVCASRAWDSHALLTISALLKEDGREFEEAAEAYAEAARRWHDFSVPYEEAQARLGLGRCLVALGRAPEAAPALTEARAIFEKLGARPALADTETLLGEIGAHSA
jgi:class 3 adenylate cyclase